MSGIWYYALALTGVSVLTIVMVFTIRFTADELLGRTRQVWRLARPVWLTFTTAFTLLFVGAGLLSIATILLLTPFGGRLPDSADLVLVLALVAGAICAALGMLGLLIWIAFALVASLSTRRVARIDRKRPALAFVYAGLIGIAGGVEAGATVHAWPLSLVIGIVGVGIALLIAVIMVCMPRS